MTAKSPLPHCQRGAVLGPRPRTNVGIDQSVVVLGRRPRRTTEQPDRPNWFDASGPASDRHCLRQLGGFASHPTSRRPAVDQPSAAATVADQHARITDSS